MNPKPPSGSTVGCVILAIAMMVSLFGRAQELPWVHFSPDQLNMPLPSASVQMVHQDRLGYIWFGFYSSGLGRYDGHSLETYDIPDGLANSTVREILEDAHGYLWVGTETGIVVSERPLDDYFAQERIRFRSRIGDINLPSSRIRINWMAPAPDGSVFVVTANKEVIRYRLRGTGELAAKRFAIESEDDDRFGPPLALAIRADGSVWLALEQRGLLILKPDEESFIDSRLGPDFEDDVQTIYESPDRELWFGCRNGEIWRLDESKTTARAVRVSTQLADSVLTILRASNGELWAGSVFSGALRIDERGRGAQDRITLRNGLPSETVWDIKEDREGNLWVAHNAGVSRLRPGYRAFTHYTAVSRDDEGPVLPEPAVFAVIPAPPESPDEPMWVGTGGGLAAVLPDGSSTSFGVDDGLTSSAIYALARDHLGRLWVGTNVGLNVIHDGLHSPPPLHSKNPEKLKVFSKIRQLNTFALGTIYACRELPIADPEHPDADRTAVWITGTDGLICLFDNHWYLFSTAAGLPAAGTFMVEVDPNGYIWSATRDTGVLISRQPVDTVALRELRDGASSTSSTLVDRSVFKRLWNSSTGAPSDCVHNLVWTGDRMWVGTATGLATIEGDPPQTGLLLNRDNGLVGDRVMAMALNPKTSTLWVSQNEGIAEIDPITGSVLRTVSKHDGLIDNEVWQPAAMSISDQGEILFGTPKGLSVFQPELQRKNVTAPSLRFRWVEIEQDNSGHNEVLFEYAALSFVSEQQVRYRTRLLGYQEQWSGDKRDTTFRFNNLPASLFERRYTFEVVAANNSGIWTETPLRYEFGITPPIWLRWWAIAAYLFVFGIAFVSFIEHRTQRLRHRTHELEMLVSERTAEIEARASELETLDQIVETINREVVLEKVMEALLEQGMVLIPRARRAAFFMRDAEFDEFRVVAVSGWNMDQVKSIVFSSEEAEDRYASNAHLLAEGIHLIDDLDNRSGAAQVQHLPQSESLLTVDLRIGGQILAFLVFDLELGADATVSLDPRTLQRYRQHAISALDKARVVRELEDKSREAAHSSAAKSAFLATMSHELRTPLNSIIGFSEILRTKIQDDGDHRLTRFVANIQTSGKHLLALINDILDLSKIEAGRMQLDLERADIVKIVDGVNRVMTGVASKHNIKLQLDIPVNLPDASLDVPKLKQILYNLVSNAVKFSPQNTSVTISVRRVAAASSPIGCDAISFAVKDRGIGIRPEDHELIFEEFQQLDGSASRAFAGTGLGLALVRRFVEIQGGIIELESALGAGSTFTVTLPEDVSAVVDSAIINTITHESNEPDS